MKILKFILLIFLIYPTQFWGQTIYEELIQTSIGLTYAKGTGKLVLFENGRFTYFPDQYYYSSIYGIGYWEEKGDSITLEFKDDRVELLDEASEKREFNINRKGIILSLGIRNPFGGVGNLRDVELKIYSDNKEYFGKTDNNGKYENVEIIKIDSIVVVSGFFSKDWVLTNINSQADSIIIEINYGKLSDLAGNAYDGETGSKIGWMEGTWEISDNVLIKNKYNLTFKYQKVE